MSNKIENTKVIRNGRNKYEKPKSCFVPQCFNSSTRTPDKHFIYVRKGNERLEWLSAARITCERSMTTNMYCCQDHFDLENDFETDFVSTIAQNRSPRLKPGILPHLNLDLQGIPKFDTVWVRTPHYCTIKKEVDKIDISELSETPLRFPENFPECSPAIPQNSGCISSYPKKRKKNQPTCEQNKTTTEATSKVQKLSSNNIKYWDIEPKLKEKFLNTLSCYLVTGIQLTPLYLKQSFIRFINNTNDINLKMKLLNPEWFDILVTEHKDLTNKFESPTIIIKHKINQLILAAHFSILRFIYKTIFNGKHMYAHPERLYVLDEFILQISMKYCNIDIFREGISNDDDKESKNVTILFAASSFGHKVPPLVVVQSKRIRVGLKESFPQDWKVVADPIGRLTPYYFQFWIEHFANLKLPGRMILLLNHEMRKYLLDASKELIQILEDSEITIHFFHKSQKDELNPLAYGVYEKFESEVQDNVDSLSYVNGNTAITPNMLARVITSSWNEIDVGVCTESFKRAGIFPLNSGAFLQNERSSSEMSSEDEKTVRLARSTQTKSYSSTKRKTSQPCSSATTTQTKVPILTSSIKTEKPEHSISTEPNIDLDTSTLNSQTTLEIDFSESKNYTIPISKLYFASPKKQQELSNFVDCQFVKIEMNDPDDLVPCRYKL